MSDFGAMAGMIGKHVRDTTTGIAGRVICVCINERCAPEYRLRRYGVTSSGDPFALLWVYVEDCSAVSEEDAREC